MENQEYGWIFRKTVGMNDSVLRLEVSITETQDVRCDRLTEITRYVLMTDLAEYPKSSTRRQVEIQFQSWKTQRYLL